MGTVVCAVCVDTCVTVCCIILTAVLRALFVVVVAGGRYLADRDILFGDAAASRFENH